MYKYSFFCDLRFNDETLTKIKLLNEYTQSKDKKQKFNENDFSKIKLLLKQMNLPELYENELNYQKNEKDGDIEYFLKDENGEQTKFDIQSLINQTQEEVQPEIKDKLNSFISNIEQTHINEPTDENGEATSSLTSKTKKVISSLQKELSTIQDNINSDNMNIQIYEDLIKKIGTNESLMFDLNLQETSSNMLNDTDISQINEDLKDNNVTFQEKYYKRIYIDYNPKDEKIDSNDRKQHSIEKIIELENDLKTDSSQFPIQFSKKDKFGKIIQYEKNLMDVIDITNINTHLVYSYKIDLPEDVKKIVEKQIDIFINTKLNPEKTNKKYDVNIIDEPSNNYKKEVEQRNRNNPIFETLSNLYSDEYPINLEYEKEKNKNIQYVNGYDIYNNMMLSQSHTLEYLKSKHNLSDNIVDYETIMSGMSKKTLETLFIMQNQEMNKIVSSDKEDLTKKLPMFQQKINNFESSSISKLFKSQQINIDETNENSNLTNEEQELTLKMKNIPFITMLLKEYSNLKNQKLDTNKQKHLSIIELKISNYLNIDFELIDDKLIKQFETVNNELFLDSIKFFKNQQETFVFENVYKEILNNKVETRQNRNFFKSSKQLLDPQLEKQIKTETQKLFVGLTNDKFDLTQIEQQYSKIFNLYLDSNELNRILTIEEQETFKNEISTIVKPLNDITNLSQNKSNFSVLIETKQGQTGNHILQQVIEEVIKKEEKLKIKKQEKNINFEKGITEKGTQNDLQQELNSKFVNLTPEITFDEININFVDLDNMFYVLKENINKDTQDYVLVEKVEKEYTQDYNKLLSKFNIKQDSIDTVSTSIMKKFIPSFITDTVNGFQHTGTQKRFAKELENLQMKYQIKLRKLQSKKNKNIGIVESINEQKAQKRKLLESGDIYQVLEFEIQEAKMKKLKQLMNSEDSLLKQELITKLRRDDVSNQNQTITDIILKHQQLMPVEIERLTNSVFNRYSASFSKMYPELNFEELKNGMTKKIKKNEQMKLDSNSIRSTIENYVTITNDNFKFEKKFNENVDFNPNSKKTVQKFDDLFESNGNFTQKDVVIENETFKFSKKMVDSFLKENMQYLNDEVATFKKLDILQRLKDSNIPFEFTNEIIELESPIQFTNGTTKEQIQNIQKLKLERQKKVAKLYSKIESLNLTNDTNNSGETTNEEKHQQLEKREQTKTFILGNLDNHSHNLSNFNIYNNLKSTLIKNKKIENGESISTFFENNPAMKSVMSIDFRNMLKTLIEQEITTIPEDLKNARFKTFDHTKMKQEMSKVISIVKENNQKIKPIQETKKIETITNYVSTFNFDKAEQNGLTYNELDLNNVETAYNIGNPYLLHQLYSQDSTYLDFTLELSKLGKDNPLLITSKSKNNSEEINKKVDVLLKDKRFEEYQRFLESYKTNVKNQEKLYKNFKLIRQNLESQETVILETQKDFQKQIDFTFLNSIELTQDELDKCQTDEEKTQKLEEKKNKAKTQKILEMDQKVENHIVLQLRSMQNNPNYVNGNTLIHENSQKKDAKVLNILYQESSWQPHNSHLMSNLKNSSQETGFETFEILDMMESVVKGQKDYTNLFDNKMYKTLLLPKVYSNLTKDFKSKNSFQELFQQHKSFLSSIQIETNKNKPESLKTNLYDLIVQSSLNLDYSEQNMNVILKGIFDNPNNNFVETNNLLMTGFIGIEQNWRTKEEFSNYLDDSTSFASDDTIISLKSSLKSSLEKSKQQNSNFDYSKINSSFNVLEKYIKEYKTSENTLALKQNIRSILNEISNEIDLKNKNFVEPIVKSEINRMLFLSGIDSILSSTQETKQEISSTQETKQEKKRTFGHDEYDQENETQTHTGYSKKEKQQINTSVLNEIKISLFNTQQYKFALDQIQTIMGDDNIEDLMNELRKTKIEYEQVNSIESYIPLTDEQNLTKEKYELLLTKLKGIQIEFKGVFKNSDGTTTNLKTISTKYSLEYILENMDKLNNDIIENSIDNKKIKQDTFNRFKKSNEKLSNLIAFDSTTQEIDIENTGDITNEFKSEFEEFCKNQLKVSSPEELYKFDPGVEQDKNKSNKRYTETTTLENAKKLFKQWYIHGQYSNALNQSINNNIQENKIEEVQTILNESQSQKQILKQKIGMIQHSNGKLQETKSLKNSFDESILNKEKAHQIFREYDANGLFQNFDGMKKSWEEVNGFTENTDKFSIRQSGDIDSLFKAQDSIKNVGTRTLEQGKKKKEAEIYEKTVMEFIQNFVKDDSEYKKIYKNILTKETELAQLNNQKPDGYKAKIKSLQIEIDRKRKELLRATDIKTLMKHVNLNDPKVLSQMEGFLKKMNNESKAIKGWYKTGKLMNSIYSWGVGQAFSFGNKFMSESVMKVGDGMQI